MLLEAKETIRQLRWNLECALERIQDAEEGALTLLDENDEIYNQVKLALTNITRLQRELEKSRRGTIIGFTFGGVSFGIGTPLIVEGIRMGNPTMAWSGVGIIGVGSLVWTTGRFFLKWW